MASILYTCKRYMRSKLREGLTLPTLRLKMEDAIEKRENKTILHLKVKSGSKRNKFPSGYDEWRKRICIDVMSSPIGGKANREIISTLTTFFGRNALLISGERSKEKNVLIEMERDEVLKKIKNGL